MKFTQAVRIMGGTFDMANFLPMCLQGGTLGWLGNLEPHSIDS